MRLSENTLSLYLVTDRSLSLGRDLQWIVKEAVSSGVSIVQLREKNISSKDFFDLGLMLKKELAPLGVPLIINDRVDIALACDADGVHLGQHDMPCDIARRLLGPDKIIGLSVENFEELQEANSLDVDYVAASPVFGTPTKTDTARPWGLDGLEEFVKRSKHPVVGIGGMNVATASPVIAMGAAGVAVVSAIVSAQSPAESARQLRMLIDNEKARRV